MTSSCATLCCPKCGKALGKGNFIGANLAKTTLYFLCPDCRTLIRVVEDKPEEKAWR